MTMEEGKQRRNKKKRDSEILQEEKIHWVFLKAKVARLCLSVPKYILKHVRKLQEKGW